MMTAVDMFVSFSSARSTPRTRQRDQNCLRSSIRSLRKSPTGPNTLLARRTTSAVDPDELEDGLVVNQWIRSEDCDA